MEGLKLGTPFNALIGRNALLAFWMAWAHLTRPTWRNRNGSWQKASASGWRC
jgi:hypothetical protein